MALDFRRTPLPDSPVENEVWIAELGAYEDRHIVGVYHTARDAINDAVAKGWARLESEFRITRTQGGTITSLYADHDAFEISRWEVE